MIFPKIELPNSTSNGNDASKGAGQSGGWLELRSLQTKPIATEPDQRPNVCPTLQPATSVRGNVDIFSRKA